MGALLPYMRLAMTARGANDAAGEPYRVELALNERASTDGVRMQLDSSIVTIALTEPIARPLTPSARDLSP